MVASRTLSRDSVTRKNRLHWPRRGHIAASGFICEEGTEGAVVGASDAQDNAAGAQGTANNNNNAQIATGSNKSDDAEVTAGNSAQQDAENDAPAQTGNNNGAQQDQAGDSQDAGNSQDDNARNAENAQQDEAGSATSAEDDAATGDATGADATNGNGAGVNLFDLALQGFQPVDCTGIDEAVVAASGFNCIDGTRGA